MRFKPDDQYEVRKKQWMAPGSDNIVMESMAPHSPVFLRPMTGAKGRPTATHHGSYRLPEVQKYIDEFDKKADIAYGKQCQEKCAREGINYDNFFRSQTKEQKEQAETEFRYAQWLGIDTGMSLVTFQMHMYAYSDFVDKHEHKRR